MNIRIRAIYIVLLVLLISGCVGTKHLKEDEVLLHKQKIKGNKELSKTSLNRAIRQSPNRRFLIFPFSFHAWLYRTGINSYDTAKLISKKENLKLKFDNKIAAASKDKKKSRLIDKRNRKVDKVQKVLNEGNLFMRSGEPLAVYDSAMSEQSIEQLERLMHSRSFFNGEASYKVDYRGKKVIQTFVINEKESFKIDTIYYRIRDENVHKLVSSSKSLLKTGEPYSQKTLNDERTGWIIY